MRLSIFTFYQTVSKHLSLNTFCLFHLFQPVRTLCQGGEQRFFPKIQTFTCKLAQLDLGIEISYLQGLRRVFEHKESWIESYSGESFN